MNHLDDYLIHKSLPESLARQNVMETAEVVDRTLLKYDSIIPRVLIYPVIDELPSELVDALAVQLHCDFYDYTLSLARRREIVKQSIAWHRIKGTRGAVELAVRAVFGDVKVEEWYEYGGKPYTFRIKVEGAGAFDETHGIDLLMKIINASKNVRSWLDSEGGGGGEGNPGITIHYEVRLSGESTIRYGFANLMGGVAHIGIARPGDGDGPAILKYITEVISGASGRRIVGTGPAEVRARLAQSQAFAHINAGVRKIPADLSDLPEWQRSIAQPSRIRQAMGFAYARKGKRQISPALPEPGAVTLAPLVLSGVSGSKGCGIALPREAAAACHIGQAVAVTGYVTIGADMGDLPRRRARAHVGIMQAGLSAVG